MAIGSSDSSEDEKVGSNVVRLVFVDCKGPSKILSLTREYF
jgi:hypothetical protein